MDMLMRTERICTPKLYFNTSKSNLFDLSNFSKRFQSQQAPLKGQNFFPFYILMKPWILNRTPINDETQQRQ